MEEHYNRIADKYDYLFGYEESYAADHAADMIKHLALQKTDILADIGGGTGKWSRSILSQLKLDNDIILVDRNETMVNIGNQVPGISGVCENVMGFLNQEGLCFNKCLVRSCIHHVTDVETFLARLHAVAPLQKVLILVRAEGLKTIPVFQKAHQAIANVALSIPRLVELAKTAGFEVHRTSVTYQVSIQKDYWLRCIEQRVFSTLDHFTDEELKEGQKEICEHFPEDILKFPDIWNFIVLSCKV